MALADEIYPYSTQSGDPIPLDIIKPLAVLPFTFSTAFTALTIPATYVLSSILSDQDVIIDFSNSLAGFVSGTSYNNVLFLPAGVITVASIPTGTVKVKGLTAGGSLVIQALQKWSALALPRQLSVKTS
jgi:hypothetical protein